MADLRVVEADAVFGVFCRRWGVPLIDGGTVRLPRIVGMGRALDLILTGRPVAADEALRWAWPAAWSTDGTARAAAEALAREIAAFPQALHARRPRVGLRPVGPAAGPGPARRGRRGVPVVFAEAVAGAARFVDGAGRHGSF